MADHPRIGQISKVEETAGIILRGYAATVGRTSRRNRYSVARLSGSL